MELGVQSLSLQQQREQEQQKSPLNIMRWHLGCHLKNYHMGGFNHKVGGLNLQEFFVRKKIWQKNCQTKFLVGKIFTCKKFIKIFNKLAIKITRKKKHLGQNKICQKIILANQIGKKLAKFFFVQTNFLLKKQTKKIVKKI